MHAAEAIVNGQLFVNKMTTCITCKQITEKYKCPKCLQYYCSVSCYSEHKLDTAACVEKSNNTTLSENVQIEAAVRDPFTTEDTVPNNKLEMLKECDELKNLLYNPHLRNLLMQINVANNAEKAMKAAMQEPLFLEFADVCLKTVEPNEEDT